jgi:lipopolysaccharide/colanic/teichoic acid biosynthesis glycosyltransferase
MYHTHLNSILPGTINTAWELHFTPHSSVQSKFKRSFDILGSLVGLLILAIVFIPIAIAIKIDSPGPIFFTQERYGLQGTPFRLRKFRSMVHDAEQLKSLVSNEAEGLIFKNKNDFRVTKVGGFLRSTSLVGTRPPTKDEVVNYTLRHWQRLNVKPGITGEWQVNGRSHIKDFEQIVDLDLRYQNNWHPLYDLMLIGKTFYVIFGRIGAF